MLTLAFRTDKPEAELYLFEDEQKVGELRWQAHRELAETIHSKISELLSTYSQTNSKLKTSPRTNLTSQVSTSGDKKEFSDELKKLDGIVVFRGPGSFTGLRIGVTIANALAYGLQIPIAGSLSDDWQKFGLQKLVDGQNDKIVTPEYGAEPNVTKPKK